MTATQRINKRALLIGINTYPNLPAYSQLNGCVNDVLLIKDILETTFGFPASNITVLCDLEATGAGIRQAMKDLLDHCQPDDIVVFHYSGHGSQMAAQGDKPRGYDESIMPCDSGRLNSGFPVAAPPTDVRDTEIEEWLTLLAKKTPHITLIFDSCHSGSITRMVGDEDEGTILRWIPPDPLPASKGTSPQNTPFRLCGSGWLSLSSRYVLLAACAAEQGAYELEHEETGSKSKNGAFTFFLANELRQATANYTYQDVWERVALQVNNRFRNQTPQLEGFTDRTLFDVEDIKPMRYLLVTGRQKNEITLAGGAVHGVSVDSRWQVYPAATKQVAETVGTELGTIKIASVDALISRGVVVSETSPMAIEQGGRAVEIVHIDHETKMSVYFEPAFPGFERHSIELQRSLTQSGLLRIADSTGSARAVISMTVVSNESGDPPQWDVCDRSGAHLMHQYSVDSPDAASRIKHNLETIWRYEKILQLRNPDSTLQGKVDFVLLRKGRDGRWHSLEQGEAGFSEGDKIAFRVINRTGRSIHVSVVDLGISRRIGLLYPSASASEEIAAVHRSVENATSAAGVLSVGEKAATEIELFLPDDLTLIPAHDEQRGGKEFFKLIVTTGRHDLRFLEQPGLRDQLGIPGHPLERLIYLASGPGVERETRVIANPEEEWTTIERSFWLRRNRDLPDGIVK